MPGTLACGNSFRICCLLVWIHLSHLDFILAQSNEASVESLAAMAGSLQQFVDELPMLPTIQGYATTHDTIKPGNITIGMYAKKWKFHRDLPPTPVFAFGTSAKTASVPGPTIEAISGAHTSIKWENHLPSIHLFKIDDTLKLARPQSGIPTVVHLHGGLNEPESDGHSQSWFTSNFDEKGPTWKQEVYHYHNAKDPGNLWYHDHTLGLTRLNILAGLLGAYVIRKPSVERPFNLPMKTAYDRHLVVMDRSFNRDGSIFINSTGDNPGIHPEWQPEYFGDVIVVNGKAWPCLNVTRRKYRFRIINASNARFFRFALSNGLPFIQIGSDSFYLEKPVVMKEILVAPSEIADVVIDFGVSHADEILLTNSAVYPFPGGDPVNHLNGMVMKFILDKNSVITEDHSSIPNRLIPVRRLHKKDSVKTRYITMYEYDSRTGDPTHVLLNFLPFDAPTTETPKQGTTELWYIINLTDDNHPLHLHLAAFQVVSQQALNDTDDLVTCMLELKDAEKCNVWKYATKDKPIKRAPASERGWKNVYKVKPSYVTAILARFSQADMSPFPFNASAEPGYVYHCHILDHEDNEMMRPFKILP